jgi:uncharacterized protein with PQ loop repeat
MELSQILSWVGTIMGMLIGIPQLVKMVKSRKVSDHSAMTLKIASEVKKGFGCLFS